MGILPNTALGPLEPASADIVPVDTAEEDNAEDADVADDDDDDGAVLIDEESLGDVIVECPFEASMFDDEIEEEAADDAIDVEYDEMSELLMHDWGMLIDPGDTSDDWLAKMAEASQESSIAVTGAEGPTARLVAEAVPVFTAPVGIDAGVFVGCRNTRFNLVR